MELLKLVWENWLAVFVSGLAIAGVVALVPKGRSPRAAAVLQALSRLALSIPIALVLGVPAAFFGLVLGTVGVLMVLGLLLVGLCIWSCIPLLKLFELHLENQAKLDSLAAGASSNSAEERK